MIGFSTWQTYVDGVGSLAQRHAVFCRILREIEVLRGNAPHVDLKIWQGPRYGSENRLSAAVRSYSLSFSIWTRGSVAMSNEALTTKHDALFWDGDGAIPYADVMVRIKRG